MLAEHIQFVYLRYQSRILVIYSALSCNISDNLVIKAKKLTLNEIYSETYADQKINK